jgi:precorrin-3B methylase
MSGRRKLALGLAGVAVVAGGAGVYLALDARDLEDQAHRRCPEIMCADHVAANDLLERSRSRLRIANVAYGAAGLAVVGAAALWLTGGGRRDRATVAVVPSLAPDQAGAAVVGSF